MDSQEVRSRRLESCDELKGLEAGLLLTVFIPKLHLWLHYAKQHYFGVG